MAGKLCALQISNVFPTWLLVFIEWESVGHMAKYTANSTAHHTTRGRRSRAVIGVYGAICNQPSQARNALGDGGPMNFCSRPFLSISTTYGVTLGQLASTLCRMAGSKPSNAYICVMP